MSNFTITTDLDSHLCALCYQVASTMARVQPTGCKADVVVSLCPECAELGNTSEGRGRLDARLRSLIPLYGFVAKDLELIH